jgi:hypothetical protein
LIFFGIPHRPRGLLNTDDILSNIGAENKGSSTLHRTLQEFLEIAPRYGIIVKVRPDATSEESIDYLCTEVES